MNEYTQGMINLKYPAGIQKSNVTSNHRKKKVQYGHRGMTLEKDIDTTNKYYLNTNRAIIHKKPTPITVVNVDYPSRKKAKITEAYYKTPSTSDYNGIYRGKYIDFEVKETRNPTRFPFINIHEHQVEHMRECHKQGGIVFIIMRFHVHDEVFLYPIERFLVHWDNFKNKVGRKSIRYDDVKKESYQIPEKYNPRFDYLKTVDEIYFGER